LWIRRRWHYGEAGDESQSVAVTKAHVAAAFAAAALQEPGRPEHGGGGANHDHRRGERGQLGRGAIRVASRPLTSTIIEVVVMPKAWVAASTQTFAGRRGEAVVGTLQSTVAPAPAARGIRRTVCRDNPPCPAARAKATLSTCGRGRSCSATRHGRSGDRPSKGTSGAHGGCRIESCERSAPA
jgi:hypothetical protein